MRSRAVQFTYDLVPPIALAVVGGVDLAGYGGGNRVWLAALLLAATAALACIRKLPLVAFAAISAAIGASALVEPAFESLAGPFAIMFATYGLAFRVELPAALLGAAFASVVVAMAIAIDPSDSLSNIPPSLVLFVGLPWLAGWALRRRQVQAEQSDEHAARAAERERSRIARELHDVVAHGVTVMVVQAQAAQRFMETDRPAEREALVAIETTGRAALVELRRLLGVLRPRETGADLLPQPGLGSLAGLADQMREAGLQIELDVADREQLPPATGVFVYRIVQEALTNVLKHSTARRVRVSVQASATGLHIEVVDEGTPQPGRRGVDGFGIAGMRERVTLLGGRIEAGPREGGGFAVRADLPL